MNNHDKGNTAYDREVRLQEFEDKCVRIALRVVWAGIIGLALYGVYYMITLPVEPVFSVKYTQFCPHPTVQGLSLAC